MATSDDPNIHESQWVDERLSALEAPDTFQPDPARARGRLDARRALGRTHVRRAWLAAAAAVLFVVALPGPRGFAQELLARFTAGRIDVLNILRDDVPESVAATFAMTPEEWEAEPVRDIAEAARATGLRVKLPPAELLPGTPSLSIVRSVRLTTRPLDVAEIRRALEAANIVDVSVPDDWQGTTLVADGGPAVVAEYGDLSVTQAAPFRMQAPARVQFAEFMTLAFRVFGRDGDEARLLGERFRENPALVLHFPQTAPVREIPLGLGRTGIMVDEPDGSGGGVCFFWSTDDGIYIIDAERLPIERAIALAESVR